MYKTPVVQFQFGQKCINITSVVQLCGEIRCDTKLIIDERPENI